MRSTPGSQLSTSKTPPAARTSATSSEASNPPLAARASTSSTLVISRRSTPNCVNAELVAVVTGSSKKHRSTSKHDCAAEGCRLHVCRPMAASTVRQIHSIISGTLSAATRWDWISSNPARVAQRPKSKAPEPNPPSASEAARLLDAAFEMDEDWGTLVWLVMTTGIRRGEVCALRWRDVDLDAEIVEIRRNYVLHRGVGAEKDTKTHQMRRIALDSETIGLLREQQNRVAARLDQLGARIDGRRSCSVARSRRITRCPTRPMRPPCGLKSISGHGCPARYSDAHPRASPLFGDRVAHRWGRSSHRCRSAWAWWWWVDDVKGLRRMGGVI